MPFRRAIIGLQATVFRSATVCAVACLICILSASAKAETGPSLILKKDGNTVHLKMSGATNPGANVIFKSSQPYFFEETTVLLVTNATVEPTSIEMSWDLAPQFFWAVHWPNRDAEDFDLPQE